MPFRCRIPIRFGDIDQAGIAYYPTLFDHTHTAFEEFWEHGVGVSYPHLLLKDKLGFPLVHMEADFRSPLRFGDILSVEVAVTHLGRSSVTFRYRAYVSRTRKLSFEVHSTTVCLDMDSFKSTPLPQKYRRILERHRATGSRP
ncbi:MAG: acyl-CoA thioesterase [Planctomycetes bacterium]|nr:acyl-CoA thioesterase [Planctomycetota bacterium]